MIIFSCWCAKFLDTMIIRFVHVMVWDPLCPHHRPGTCPLTTAVCCCFQMVLFYFASATGGELIAPEDVCSGEAFEVCMGGGTPEIPEDWEGEPAEFCPACIDAWFFGAHLKTTTA